MTTRILVLPLIVIMICSSFSFFSFHSADGGPVDVLADAEPPVISNVSLSGSPTTGDPVTISVDVSDNMNVSSVWLVHNWSASQPTEVNNISFMRAGDMFSLTILNEANTTSPFWYMVKANDTSDNWNSSSWYSVNISDNDPPTFLFDGSTEFAYTGEAFGFVTNMDDNVGIFRASINFTIGGINYNFSMCGAGNSRQTLIVIPLEDKGIMEYFFWFSDGAGNEGTSPTFSRTIYDITPPYVIEDLTSGPVNSSDVLKIHLRVIDNWEIVEGWMNYEMEGWYQGPAMVPFLIPGDGNFTILFAIPGNFTGNFTYNATFVDSSLNQFTTENRTVIVNDGTRPKLVDDLTNRITTTGEEMIFGFKVDDNIAVSEVAVTYKFPGEDWFTSFTSYDEQLDSWLYDLDVPINREGEGQYYVKITDTSGNFYLGDVRTFYIFDNDDPEILFDDTDDTAETGRNFTFKITVRDNTGISSVKIEYSIDGTECEIQLQRTMPVSNGYLYEATIVVPDDSFGNLSYSFTIMDQRGNQVMNFGSVEIVDSILPEIVEVRFMDVLSDQRVISLSTGDGFLIEVDVSDNVDPFMVEFRYVLPGEIDEIQIILTRGLKFNNTRAFNGTIQAPNNITGPMKFAIIATDANGVDNVTFSSTIFILDNDPPELISIEYPHEIGIFSYINITLEAVDNIRVMSVFIHYTSPGNFFSESYLEMETEDGRNFTISHPVILGNLDPYSLSVEISDGQNSLWHTINITVIDDLPPQVIFITPSGRTHPDDTSILFQMTISDMTDWELVSIAFVQGDIGIVLINYTVNEELIEFYYFPTDPGNWELQVYLKDSNGLSSVSRMTFNIYDNTPPYFQILSPADNVEWDEIVKLEIDDYQDSSAISTVEWTIMGPDGEKKVYYSTSVEFEVWGEGEYRISLQITDQNGNTNEKIKWLKVEPKPEEDRTNLPLIILIVMTAMIGGLVLWVSVKEKLPEWMRNWKDR